MGEPHKKTMEERLQAIENYMIEGNLMRGAINDTLTTVNFRLKSVERRLDGDAKEDGVERRIRTLELEAKERKVVKDGFLKVAIGSLTMAIGAFVLWICKIIYAGAGKNP